MQNNHLTWCKAQWHSNLTPTTPIQPNPSFLCPVIFTDCFDRRVLWQLPVATLLHLWSNVSPLMPILDMPASSQSRHSHIFITNQTSVPFYTFPSILFPKVPMALSYICRLSEVVKVQPDGLLCAVGWGAQRWGTNEWVVSPHSGSFLHSRSSSHTFLLERGELTSAWSGCHIPVASMCPLIIVIVEPCQRLVTVLGGRIDALPFSQFIIEALPV